MHDRWRYGHFADLIRERPWLAPEARNEKLQRIACRLGVGGSIGPTNNGQRPPIIAPPYPLPHAVQLLGAPPRHFLTFPNMIKANSQSPLYNLCVYLTKLTMIRIFVYTVCER